MTLNILISLIAATLSIGTFSTVSVVRAWRRRVGAARNASDTCAQCGNAFAVREFGTVDAYLVEGQFVCSDCAPLMRRRVIMMAAALIPAMMITVYFGWFPLIANVARLGWTDGLAPLAHFDVLIGAFSPLFVLGSAELARRKMKQDNVVALETLGRLRLSPSIRKVESGDE